jgi:hypothetical protein
MKKVTILVGLLLLAAPVFAQSLITMDGGKPKAGVVTAWSGSGKKVELTVKAGTDATQVAEAIQSNVEGVKSAKVVGGKVQVVGLEQDPLLKALAEVSLGGDDVGALAQAGMDEEDGGSGSSLRAKKTAKLNELFKDRATVAKGTVVAVEGDKFPNAIIKVKILAGPTGPAGKTVRKGATVAFTPVIAVKGGHPDLADENTQVNMGAWFLKPKDAVQVKVGKEVKDGYEAVVISR